MTGVKQGTEETSPERYTKDYSVKASAQLLVDNEDPLTRLDPVKMDKMEQDVTLAYSSTHPVYQSVKVVHVQQVETNNTCCKAMTTHFSMEHQVGSYHCDFLVING